MVEFSEGQNLNFRNLSKSSSLAVVAFSIFGLLNVLGLLTPFGRQNFTSSALLTGLNIVLILSCLFSALAFKKASTKYTLIVTTENSDIPLLAAGGQQLQKAFTWAAVTVLFILIRSAYFHSQFDFVVSKFVN